MSFAIFFLSLGVSKIFEASKLVLTGNFTHDDQDGRRVFVCSFLIIDVATRFKAGRSLTSRNSLEIWNVVKEIYEDPSNPLTWPELLMTDGDASF